MKTKKTMATCYSLSSVPKKESLSVPILSRFHITPSSRLERDTFLSLFDHNISLLLSAPQYPFPHDPTSRPLVAAPVLAGAILVSQLPGGPAANPDLLNAVQAGVTV